ncbi:MAG: preprotein translocase subunit SecG [Gammaproteobacteria bacterium]
MLQLINVLHILVSICIIVLVLLQRGKGSDMGAGFGSGSSSSVFGSQGSTPFLVKFTAILAFIFFLTSAVMSFLVSKQMTQGEVIPIPAEQEIPVSNS